MYRHVAADVLIADVEAVRRVHGPQRAGQPPVGGSPARDRRDSSSTASRLTVPTGQAPVDGRRPKLHHSSLMKSGRADRATGCALHRPSPHRCGPGRRGHSQHDDWVGVIDAVLRDGLLRPVRPVRVCTRRTPGEVVKGASALRAVLDDRLGDDPVPLSEWSRMVEDLLAGSGLSASPPRVPDLRPTPGALLAQVDLAYPAHRVAIELDSVRYHLNRESFISDPRRRNRLTVAGWKVLSPSPGTTTSIAPVAYAMPFPPPAALRMRS